MLILQRIVGVILALLLGAAALVFASVVLALAAAIALVFGGWLWWRGRGLRRASGRARGAVIEGEFREVPEGRLEDRPR